MPLWKVLHVVAMFSAVTLLVGGDVFFHALRRTGDRAALRRFLGAINPLFGLGVALLTLGVVFGIATAATGSWDFFARWLVGAYVIVAVLYLVGLFVGLPYYRSAAAALASDGTTDDRALDDPRGWGSMLISVAGYLAIIFLMIVKPGV
jgi:uncharacterized membrane protein